MGYLGPNFNQNPFRKTPRQPQQASPATGGQPAGGVPQGAGPGGSPFPNLAAEVLFKNLQGLQARMSPKETSLLMKSILGLPREIQTFFALLAAQQKPGQLTPENLKQLLAQMPEATVLPEQIQKALGDQTKETLAKLMKTLQGNQMAAMGDQQLKELVGTLSALSAGIASSQTESLQILMLLYIPWYPLMGDQRLELRFEDGENQEGGGGSDAPLLVLYIDTNTLGRFRITARKQDEQLFLEAEHDPAAETVLKTIQQELDARLRTDGIQTPRLVFIPREGDSTTAPPLPGDTVASAPAAAGEDNQKVAVHPARGVSILVLNAAYQLARVIFEIDERNTLNRKRARSAE